MTEKDIKDRSTLRSGEIATTASAFAPLAFFEGVPFYGAKDGIGTLALSATRLVNAENGEVIYDQALSAHLKGSLSAYRLLGQTVAAIIQLLEAEESQRAANAAVEREREMAGDRAMAILQAASEPEFRN